MFDFVNHVGSLAQNVDIQALVAAPLSFLCLQNKDDYHLIDLLTLANPHPEASATKASASLSLFPGLCVFILFVRQLWMPSSLPLVIHFE